MSRLHLLRKSTVDAEPRPENEKARLRRLHAWALGFAITVSCVAMPPMVFGFGWSMFVVPVAVFIGLFPPLLFVNRHTVTLMDGAQPPPAVPRFRVAIALVLAAFVAGAATLWVFQARIDAVRSEQDPTAWDNEMRQLQADRERYTSIVERPPPPADQDQEVVRLRQQLDTAETELIEAEKNALCELDGKCGTGVPGEGDAYYARVAWRDELKKQVTDLRIRLDAAKNRAADEANKYVDAVEELHDIDRRMDELGPTRPAEPTRLQAAVTVAKRQELPVGGVCVGTFVVFLVLDVAWLYTIARRICRPADGTGGGSIKRLVDDQFEKSTLGIKTYDEYRAAGGDD